MKFAAITLLAGFATVPATAQTRTPLPTPAQAPADPVQAPAAGVAVLDTQGASVGTIESVAGELAVVDTGTNKVRYPTTSMTPGPKGVIIALTKAQLDASFVEQQAKAKAELQTRLAAGTQVFASDGTTQIATIKSVDAEFVTMTASNGSDLKVPVSGFATGRTGVVVGLSAADVAKATAGGS